MTEVKYDKSHHAGGTPEARIANRLRNSGGNDADHIVQKGTSPNRTFTNVWHSGHVVQPGTAPRETGPQEQRHHSSATTQSVGYSPKGEDR
jgi:hypothetical protein